MGLCEDRQGCIFTYMNTTETSTQAPAPRAFKVSGYLASTIKNTYGVKVSASAKTGQIVLTVKEGTVDDLLAALAQMRRTVLVVNGKKVTIS
jgi:hypothetical protein